MRFILASASPARLRTLTAAGVDPEVIVSGVDEDAFAADTPAALVQLLADAKANAVAARVTEAVVLGCDSLLEFEADAHGKPADADAARALWRRIRGRSGVLHTGHCLVQTSTGTKLSRTASTEVRFADVSDAEIEAYICSGEPLNVAGGFTLDGLGGWYVDAVAGDHHNVVGLSLPLLRRMLAELGIAVTELNSGQRPGAL